MFYWIYDLFDMAMRNKKNTIILIIVLIFSFGIWSQYQKQQKAAERQERLEKREQENTSSSVQEYVEGTDAYLMSMQEELRKNYGTPPKGFIWDLSGNPVSLGDKSMSSEDVLYSYLRSLSTLDFATAQKFSRDTKVVETFSEYLSSKNARNSDYQDAFLRNMYRTALTSLEVEEVESSAKFANNKVSYTVRMNMLDLTSKDFWEDEREKLFEEMNTFDHQENDSTKVEIFLYDYILKYYKSKNAVKREVTFDITLERYPDIDSGWLVSIDKDIDDAARYTNGTLVTTYIREQFRDWAVEERLKASENNSSENKSEKNSSPTTSAPTPNSEYPLQNED